MRPVQQRFSKKKIMPYFILMALFLLRVAPAEGTLHSFAKKETPKVQPNVLILVDTSGSMTWKIGNDENLASKNNTFGDGSRPAIINSKKQYYFGRDLNSANNEMTGYNYHPNLQYIDPNDLPSYKNDLVRDPEKNLYKYPNDSRMYTLKNVMYRLLDDKTYVGNLRLALSSYYGIEKIEHKSNSNYYRVFDYGTSRPDTRQKISRTGDLSTKDRPTSTSKASLLVSFGSTDEEQHLLSIKNWFDGIEESGNPELRAFGATPLALSIYDVNNENEFKLTNKDGGDENAYTFFTANFGKDNAVITHECQDNWLIVLTDGEDWFDDTNDLVDHAVRYLYQKSAALKIKGNSIRPVRTFVIGMIDPSTQTTLKNQLNRMAKYGWDGTLTNNKTAYYPQNMGQLFDAFRDIFLTIQEQAASGTAPLATPSRSSTGEEYFYQASYLPRAGKQWEGYLHKFEYDGENFTEKWEASVELKKKLEKSELRNIYTTGAGLSNATKIVDSNGSIRSLMGLTTTDDPNLSEEEAKRFIRWITGTKETGYQEDYKLFDIYHSGMVKIGPPDPTRPDASYQAFYKQHWDRENLIYVQSNGGMVHAFSDGDGEEKFAFVPPNVLASGRLRGLKWLDTANKFDKAEYTHPRYLLDGPLIAEDIVLDGNFRTALFGLLGLGGAGMYALDVTTPSSPKFLWAVENAVYDPIKESADNNPKVMFWNGSTGNTVMSSYSHKDDFKSGNQEFDYRDLRFTTSTPYIGYLPTGEWAFVLGNGSPRFISSSKGAIYIGNMANGKIIKKIDHANPLISPVAVINEGIRSLIRTFFIGDTTGNILKTQYNAITKDWDTSTIFTLTSNVGLSYSLDAAKFKGNVWLFAGTGDVEGYISEQTASTGQVFVAVNIDYESSPGIKDPAKNDKDSRLTVFDAEALDNIALNNGTVGWVVEFSFDKGKNIQERLSTPPMVYNGYVYFASYTPNPDVCATGGTSRIYAMDAVTGKGGWKDNAKFAEFENIAVTGMTISKGKLAIGITRFGNSSTPEGVDFDALGENLLVTDVPAGGGGGGDSGIMQPFYWKSR